MTLARLRWYAVATLLKGRCGRVVQVEPCKTYDSFYNLSEHRSTGVNSP